jgi:3-deoxy-manno-octulosonate cytidylyltransferase (CMP-KDO synthetase)
MKAVGIIPARYQSTRFEGKALALLGGRPVIEHVYQRARKASLLDDVWVATDDERIAAAVQRAGGKTVMTSPSHPSGTDRVAEAAARIDCDVVVNIQGDEPFIAARAIDQAIEPFATRPELAMTTLMRPIPDEASFQDPNVVKVVVDQLGYALYFSRAAVPYRRRLDRFQAFEHIGLYAYRKEFLLSLARLAPTTLEHSEALEQLRVLEHGHRILAIETAHHVGLSIDTPEDLRRAEEFLAKAQGAVAEGTAIL